MEQAFMLRQLIIHYFKRFETIIMFIIKFLIGFFIFSIINSNAVPMEQFSKFFEPPYIFIIKILLSLIFAVSPISLSYYLIILNIALSLSGALYVGVFVVLFLLCVMFLYARLAPNESVLILALYIGFYFKIPYLIPIVAGLYFGITSVIPMIIGSFIWYSASPLQALLKEQNAIHLDLAEAPTAIEGVYTNIFNNIASGETWVFSAFIFVMILIAVFVISRTSINYAREIAILSGTAICIVSTIVLVLVAKANLSILLTIVFALISAIIAIVICFFDKILDYREAQTVRFEDDNNYYFVKVIPKVDTMQDYEELEEESPKDNHDGYKNYKNYNEYENYNNYESRKDYDRNRRDYEEE